jgi:hypothetical protein
LGNSNRLGLDATSSCGEGNWFRFRALSFVRDGAIKASGTAREGRVGI